MPADTESNDGDEEIMKLVGKAHPRGHEKKDAATKSKDDQDKTPAPKNLKASVLKRKVNTSSKKTAQPEKK